MRKLLFVAAVFIPAGLYAQNTLTSDIVEGGKTLVELIRIFRAPAVVVSTNMQPAITYVDSCSAKKLADISFKNKTDKNVEVSLYLRVGINYDTKPLMLTLSAFSQESLYELKAGIYKYKITVSAEQKMQILHEGELKLLPCDKLVREIK
ncbi:MAG: hypothetical protein IPL84_07300 [Chitinophagaceae bacterium]|nr:hypothetical protein [Chitinophagaceae bacterium]